jgi:hypothetical protein
VVTPLLQRSRVAQLGRRRRAERSQHLRVAVQQNPMLKRQVLAKMAELKQHERGHLVHVDEYDDWHSRARWCACRSWHVTLQEPTPVPRKKIRDSLPIHKPAHAHFLQRRQHAYSIVDGTCG